MGFKKFSLLLTMRLFLIVATLIGISYALSQPGYSATTFLLSVAFLAQTYEVFKFVSKTNAEISRFLDAARYADYSQRFNLKPLGAGFGELGSTFTDILERFHDVRTSQEEDLRHLKALIEHVPVPLLAVHNDGAVVVWNNAARRLFGAARIVRVADLQQFGAGFYNEVTSIRSGQRRLATFENDGTEQQITIAATEIIISGAKETLISLQDIQSELDVAQVQAWQDLVRVLTHEIMNSITPVASLSKTTVDLVEDVVEKLGHNPELVEELKDVRDAVNTIARRSDSLTQFISSYRSLTRLPKPDKVRMRMDALFTQVASIATLTWGEKGIKLSTSIDPDYLEIDADSDLIEQVLINLLLNAEHAVSNTKNAEVFLRATLNRRGRLSITVEDNGPGISADIGSKVFVPFFTTKREGSGVGLAFSRQVMIAHGGSIILSENQGGGAKFILTF